MMLAMLGTLALLLAPAAPVRAQEGPPPSGPGAELEVLEEGPSGPCGVLPGVVETVCDGVDTALTWGIQPVVAGGAQAVLHEMVAFVVDGAGWLLEQIASFLDTSTRPQLTSSWFERAYQDMAAVAVFGLLPFLLLAIVQGIVRQDPGMLLRATFGYVPLAAVGTAAGVVVVDLLVQMTDELTRWISRSLGSDLASFSTGMGEALAGLPLGSGGAVAGLAALLAAGVVAFAAFAIWLELLLRQAAIYVAVLFLPLGFMAMVWPATAHWLRRLVQGLVAIILSKFVIVAVMALAATALGGTASEAGGSDDVGGFGVVLAGASMLALAALAPYVLLRLIPVFEAGLSGDLEGTFRRPTAAVASPASGHHLLQTVRQRAGASDGPGTARLSADGGQGREAGVFGGPSGAPATSPSSASAGPGPEATSTTTSGTTSGPAAGTTAGSAGASGAAVGAGAVAVAGAVAAGAGGAKRVGEHLQSHGTEQQVATAGSSPGSSGSSDRPPVQPATSARPPVPPTPPNPAPDPTPRTPTREER